MTPHTAAPTLCVCISALLVLAVTGKCGKCGSFDHPNEVIASPLSSCSCEDGHCHVEEGYYPPLSFEFQLYKNPPFSRKLECSVDANSSSQDIFTIIDLTIFDVTNNRTAKKLAAISVLDTDLYVDHVSKSFLAVEGSVSQHYADLSVTFSNQTYCLLCSFLCELNFINPNGHPVVRHSTVKSSPAGSDCSYSGDVSVGVANQMMAAVERLAGITHDVEDRLSERLAQLEEKLDNITGLEEMLDNMAVLKERLDNITALLTSTVVETKKVKTTPGAISAEQCKEGMANVTKDTRILVKILDNKPALCDTNTEGGGWIIIQKRTDGKENFYRPWTDYVSGFGDIEGGGDYWLGLQSIHELTSQGTFELLVEMEKDGKNYYAQYNRFHLGNLSSMYQLSIGDYTGNSTDSLDYHRNRRFSTYDRDNDDSSSNCAVSYQGAWWYGNCHDSNLNGKWEESSPKGVGWDGIGYPVSMTEMKIRLVQ